MATNHRASRRRPALVVLLGVLLAGLLTFGVLSMLDGNDAETAADDTTPSSSESSGDASGEDTDSSSEEPSDSTEAASGETCVQRTEDVVVVARRGVSHFQTHTTAHFRWANGEISETKKSATYKRTRLAGPQDQVDYRKAVTAREDAGCDELEVSAECQSAIDDTLTAADAAMGGWGEHLDNMAAYAAGEFDATEAQRRWDSTLASSRSQIRDFKGANRSLTSSDCL